MKRHCEGGGSPASKQNFLEKKSVKLIPFLLSSAGDSSHEVEVPHLSASPSETLSDVSCDLNFPAIKQFRDVLTDYVEDDGVESIANEILRNKDLREQLREDSEN